MGSLLSELLFTDLLASKGGAQTRVLHVWDGIKSASKQCDSQRQPRLGAGTRPGDAAAGARALQREGRRGLAGQRRRLGAAAVFGLPECPSAPSRPSGQGRGGGRRYSLLVGVVEGQRQPVPVHGAHVAQHLLGAVVGGDEDDLEGGGRLALLQ